MRDEATGEPRLVDEDGVPIEPDDTESEPFYEFQLYEHAVVAGAPRMVGVQNLHDPGQARRQRPGPRHGVSRLRRRPGQVSLPARDRRGEENEPGRRRHARPGAGCRRRCITKAKKCRPIGCTIS